MPAGQGVDRRGRLVDLGDRAPICDLGHSQTTGVAMCLTGQSADEDPANPHSVVVGGRVIVVFAADDIGVHT